MKNIAAFNTFRPITFLLVPPAFALFIAVPQLKAETTSQIVFDAGHNDVTIKPSAAQVTAAISKDAAAPGLIVTIQSGPAGYPGIAITPKSGAAWDLSTHGHVEAKIANMGAKRVHVSLRIDNEGDWQLKPFNTESVALDPGKTGIITVIFGYTYGKKPGYPLKPTQVSRMLIFADKQSDQQQIRIESIEAAGPAGETPPVNPDSIRIKPTAGYLLGGSVVLDASKQIVTKDGAEAALMPEGKSVQLAFSKAGQSVTIKPVQGAWDLREGHQVRVKIKNTGAAPATAVVRIDSRPGPTDRASKLLAPGESAEIVASFIPASPWTGITNADKKERNPTEGTGTRFVSDAASGVTFSVHDSGDGKAEGNFEVQSVVLAAPAGHIPEWLGKRPPVEGDWVPTFNEEFTGNAIDLAKWNIYTANYWDNASHFSKDNVHVGNGVATLRFEKKKGKHNDDDKGKETEYATGFLDTYGKWVQRYGYFEARMKLPKSPGLWPAMWMMPDRGLASGQGKRGSTSQDGMEIDIMEFLSRWGPYRFNIAFHWDGYGKDHKGLGTQNIYVDHDAEGYVTTGLLWLPGRAEMYNNGRLIARWESPRVCSVPCDLMFTHVSGGWDNDRLDDSKLPDDFVIDYVRCWQRKDLASEVDGVKSKQATPAAPTTADR